MAASDSPLCPNEVGTYAELTARPNPKGLVVLNEPPLAGKLSLMGFQMRRAPTLEEIQTEQNKAPAIALTRAAAEQMLARRALQGLC